MIGYGPLDGLDFETIETAARQAALRITAQAMAAAGMSATGPWIRGLPTV